MINKFKKGFRHPSLFVDYLTGKGMLNILPDEIFLRIRYYQLIGKRLNLENPVSFNEKLQWLKLHDRRPEYTMMVDKYAVRRYIADTIGERHLIPLLGVWNNPEDIDFDTLPEQFVLKCNHNSGLGMLVCQDKSVLDVENTKKGLRKGLKQNYYLTGREWPYKNVVRKIVAEKYMVDDSKTELKDYKINCFNGEPEYIQVMSGRSKGEFFLNHFDTDWKPIVIPRKNHVVASRYMEKPKHLNRMIEISKVLSKNIPYVRIDLYHTEEQVYFGEITFFPMSGFVDYADDKTDLILGNLIRLAV